MYCRWIGSVPKLNTSFILISICITNNELVAPYCSRNNGRINISKRKQAFILVLESNESLNV